MRSVETTIDNYPSLSFVKTAELVPLMNGTVPLEQATSVLASIPVASDSIYIGGAVPGAIVNTGASVTAAQVPYIFGNVLHVLSSPSF
jgi:hypothetical protein